MKDVIKMAHYQKIMSLKNVPILCKLSGYIHLKAFNVLNPKPMNAINTTWFTKIVCRLILLTESETDNSFPMRSILARPALEETKAEVAKISQTPWVKTVDTTHQRGSIRRRCLFSFCPILQTFILFPPICYDIQFYYGTSSFSACVIVWTTGQHGSAAIDVAQSLSACQEN